MDKLYRGNIISPRFVRYKDQDLEIYSTYPMKTFIRVTRISRFSIHHSDAQYLSVIFLEGFKRYKYRYHYSFYSPF